VPRVRRRPRAWRYPAAAAATVLLMLAAGVFVATQAYKWAPGFYETEIGARQIVALSDGSRVELNTDTELRATVDETGRVVHLYQGEAFFNVTHDPNRAFVVHAGDRRVVVLGTQFSVRRDRERVQVTVAEGRVRVEREKPKAPAPPVVAERGEIVIAKAETEVVSPPSPEKVERQLAWRQGYLMFEKSTLGEAAAEFNRYNTRKLVIDDPAAAGTRISGRFDANNLDAYIRLLQRAYGLQIQPENDRIRVSG
jgi:transmembrane sensor